MNKGIYKIIVNHEGVMFYMKEDLRHITDVAELIHDINGEKEILVEIYSKDKERLKDIKKIEAVAKACDYKVIWIHELFDKHVLFFEDILGIIKK